MNKELKLTDEQKRTEIILFLTKNTFLTYEELQNKSIKELELLSDSFNNARRSANVLFKTNLKAFHDTSKIKENPINDTRHNIMKFLLNNGFVLDNLLELTLEKLNELYDKVKNERTNISFRGLVI